MLNYVVDPAVLQPLVPAGTELDFWRDRAYVSIVGFQFLNTRVRGVAIPLHRHFEEVNLRFYVRRRTSGGWRRGVVFIREFVPRLAIALVARTFYNENYSAVPMSHHLERTGGPEARVRAAAYAWHLGGREHHASVSVQGPPGDLAPGSEAEFIAEHYWGYTAQRDGSTIEYEVKHPRWRIWPAVSAKLNCDAVRCYGSQYAGYLEVPPASAFLAEGSEVSVHRGVRM